jgi:hypothetical protein
MSKVCILSIVVVQVAASYMLDVLGLVITFISMPILLFVCLRENRKLKAIREASNSNHAP